MKFTINKQRYFMGNRTQTFTSSQVGCTVVYGIFCLLLCYRDKPPGRRCNFVYIHSLQMADRGMNFFFFFFFNLENTKNVS